MPVWQITDYIFTAAANLLLGGYTSALTISISIIRNRLMIKKKNDQDYFVHPHYSSNHRRILISINLGLFGYLPIISSVSYSLSIDYHTKPPVASLGHYWEYVTLANLRFDH